MRISVLLSNLSSIFVFGLFYLISLYINLDVDNKVWTSMFILLIIILIFEDVKSNNN